MISAEMCKPSCQVVLTLGCIRAESFVIARQQRLNSLGQNTDSRYHSEEGFGMTCPSAFSPRCVVGFTNKHRGLDLPTLMLAENSLILVESSALCPGLRL